MLSIVIIDSTAEARTNLVNFVNDLLRADVSLLEILPRLSVKPVAPQELKFAGNVDVCIVGSKIINENTAEISKFRKLLPETSILPFTEGELSHISVIEQLVRLGADDTFTENISPQEFIKKLIVLAKRKQHVGVGTLVVVDSGKGGLGVTSVASSLAAVAVKEGSRVVVIDGDFETQDLSRFLRARPYINENLQLLFDQTRAVSREHVEQCLVEIESDGPGELFCIPPVGDQEAFYESRNSYARTFVSMLEVLDSIFDLIIVDAGSLRGGMLRSLYRVTDTALFVVNNDPSSLYASATKLRKLKSYLSSQAQLLVFENSSQSWGLSASVVRKEFAESADMKESDIDSLSLPYCKSARTWPGSGSTMYEIGSEKLKSSLESLANSVGFCDVQSSESKIDLSKINDSIVGIAGSFSSFLTSKLRKDESIEKQVAIDSQKSKGQKLIDDKGIGESDSRKPQLIVYENKARIAADKIKKQEVVIEAESKESDLDLEKLYSKPQLL